MQGNEGRDDAGTGGYGALRSTGGAGGTGGAADDFDRYDTTYYRRHYEVTPSRPVDLSYDEARSGYALGHRAAANPTYTGRTFDEVEVELRADYDTAQPGKFEAVKDFARHAFEWKTILGGLALAAGGWWAGSKLVDAVKELREEDEEDCRVYFESHPARTTGLTYDRARTGYTLGYTAARNPDYTGRGFEDVEPDLRGGFTGSYAGQYDTLRDFARRGYERGAGAGGTGGTGTTGGLGGTGTGGTVL